MPQSITHIELSMPDDARCAHCDYLLRGLPTHACPECGTAFNPEDPTTFQSQTSRSSFFAVWEGCRRLRCLRPLVCAALTWGLYAYGFSLFFWLPCVFLLLIRRAWVAGLFVALTSPFSILLFEACNNYAAGTPRYVRPLYTSIETHRGNLNPITRVRGFDPDCGTRGENSWVRATAEGLAVPIMSALVGPPRGAYTGPYPTVEESLDALMRSGVDQRDEFKRSQHIRVGAIRFPIDPERARPLRRWADGNSSRRLSAAVFQGQCLMILVPDDAYPEYSSVVLFDAANGEPLAIYDVDLSYPGTRIRP